MSDLWKCETYLANGIVEPRRRTRVLLLAIVLLTDALRPLPPPP